MIIGPKFKIARRLGAGIFEKTQTQKFALSQTRKKDGGRGPKTDFGVQMLEKQKARYSYLLTEKQFSKYVKTALAKKGNNQDLLYICSNHDSTMSFSDPVLRRLARPRDKWFLTDISW
jgi:small subunit ribosomal protein S4